MPRSKIADQTVVVGVHLSVELLERMRREAARQDRPVTSLIRVGMTDYLDRVEYQGQVVPDPHANDPPSGTR